MNSKQIDVIFLILELLDRIKVENVFEALNNTNVKHYFEVILTADDVVRHKPHPEMLEKALKTLNGNKKEAVIIGDSSKDLEAARGAGIDSILFYPDEHRVFYGLEELKKHKPTYIVKSFEELNSLLI